MGMDVMVLVFIVVVIGGLGFVAGGCFIGALLVAVTAGLHAGFLAPELALGSNILLMAVILLWRSRGLYPVSKR